MPRFAANLSMLYPEHQFLDRFAAASCRWFRSGGVICFPTTSVLKNSSNA